MYPGSIKTDRSDRVIRRSPLILAGIAITLSGSPLSAQTATGGPPTAPHRTVATLSGVESPEAEGEPTRAMKFEKLGAVVYRQSHDYELKCDLYVPEGPGPFPAVIAIHGGAWRTGSKFMMLRHAWLLAKKGYVVMAINYRHAPEHPFPAQILDCKHAVRWLRFHADRYHVAPDRIGAFGYSAGGHLAAMLATTDVEDGFDSDVEPELAGVDCHISAAIIGGGPCEFDWIESDLSVLSYWLGGTRKAQPDRYRQAAPLTYASADDAPCYFYHGVDDLLVPVTSPRKLNHALQRLGVVSSLDEVSDSGHLSTFSKLKYLRRGIQFLDRHLKADSDGTEQNEADSDKSDSDKSDSDG